MSSDTEQLEYTNVFESLYPSTSHVPWILKFRADILLFLKDKKVQDTHSASANYLNHTDFHTMKTDELIEIASSIGYYIEPVFKKKDNN